MSEEKLSFEQSLARLDAITRQMEQGNVPLEQALALFQEGTDRAQLEVVKLMKTPDGTPAETEYVRDE